MNNILYNKIMSSVAKEVKRAINENTELLNMDDDERFDKQSSAKINSTETFLNRQAEIIINDIANKYEIDVDTVKKFADGVIKYGVEVPKDYVWARENAPYAHARIDNQFTEVDYMVIYPSGTIEVYTTEGVQERLAELAFAINYEQAGGDIDYEDYEDIDEMNHEL